MRTSFNLNFLQAKEVLMQARASLLDALRQRHLLNHGSENRKRSHCSRLESGSVKDSQLL
jgi:hypothetical protein